MTAPPLRIPERGDLEIDGPTWRDLSSRAEFWGLVDRKIVKVSQAGPGAVRLSGAGYVGRARIGNRDVFLVEKTAGALRALLAYATGNSFRLESAPAPTSDLGPLAKLLLQQFAASVRRYASAGRAWAYARRRETGSLVGGRIDVTASLKLRARGLSHRVAFDRWIVSYATDTNRVIAAALLEAERIAQAIGMPGDEAADIRAMALFFADCRDAEVLFGQRARLAALADRLGSAAAPPAGDALALAAVILSHESFEPDAFRAREAPRSWFVSLQTLYEVAIRRTLGSLLAPGTRVRNGKMNAPPIFDEIDDQFTANPDIVVDGNDRWVGDVKYKTWASGGESDDLYQLLVHSTAHASGVAFLVYADEEYRMRSLGTTRDGVHAFLFAADPRELRAHLARLVTALSAAGSKRTE